MRGEDEVLFSNFFGFLRFTPTCVGKTCDSVSRAWVASGSPPHAWGRRPSLPLRRLRRRFTPTCVGKTPSAPPLPRATPVHPHMRGEDADGRHLADARTRF